MLSNVRIVLVRPAGATNVGSIARAMANMELRQLVLVAPACDHLGESARAYAVRATTILEQARVVADIPAGLAGCIRSFATTAKLGLYRRQAAISAREAAPQLLEAAAAGPVALVFGPEDRGLLLEETLLFDRLITIPSSDGYAALNLAMAVMIVAYELRLAALHRAGQLELPRAIRGPYAAEAQKAAMFQHLFAGLTDVRFLQGRGADHLRFALRHLLGRIDLTQNEVDILTGIGRQLQWYARRFPISGPPENPA